MHGAVVTIDATGCRTKITAQIASQIVTGGGDYLLALAGPPRPHRGEPCRPSLRCVGLLKAYQKGDTPPPETPPSLKSLRKQAGR